MDAIVGHGKIIDFFAKVIKNGQLSHAYCFSGPSAVGKKTVAEALSAEILQTARKKLARHPDFFLVQQELDEKTEKTKKDISVKQIRDLREQLSRGAFYGGYKVAIIDEAEKLNSEAGNAFLKTLEEPAGKTVLFLITKDEDQLPATVVSRCQLIHFLPVKEAVIIEWLKSLGETEQAEEIAKYSHGLPGLAKKWQENKDNFTVFKKELERFNSLAGKSFFEKSALMEDLFGDKKDHIAAREKLQSALDIWRMQLRNVFYKEAKSDGWPINKILEIEKKIVKAQDLLDKNINPRLLIENILLSMP